MPFYYVFVLAFFVVPTEGQKVSLEDVVGHLREKEIAREAIRDRCHSKKSGE